MNQSGIPATVVDSVGAGDSFLQPFCWANCVENVTKRTCARLVRLQSKLAPTKEPFQRELYYFEGIEVTEPVRLMLVRFMISIVVRQGRNSAMHASSVVADQPLHRAQPGHAPK